MKANKPSIVFILRKVQLNEIIDSGAKKSKRSAWAAITVVLNENLRLSKSNSSVNRSEQTAMKSIIVCLVDRFLRVVSLTVVMSVTDTFASITKGFNFSRILISFFAFSLKFISVKRSSWNELVVEIQPFSCTSV